MMRTGRRTYLLGVDRKREEEEERRRKNIHTVRE